MSLLQFNQLFHFDFLAMCMVGLVAFLGLNIAVFSFRYMQGDSAYRSYFLRFLGLIISLCIMVSSDHLILFFLAWLSTNTILSRMMVHKSSWEAASFSGRLALKNFLLGLLFLASAFLILFFETGKVSIHLISETAKQTPVLRVASVCLLLGAMTQSAIWPFHRWLLSSLNSPTPVSAMMHAGIVNGGGFILLRFGTLFANDKVMLQLIFIIGLITSMVFTTYKLIQHDIKRSLAASTVAQMGFMFSQFGLGLYSVTMAHILLHGLYKSFLFLNSGSSVHQKQHHENNEPLSTSKIIASAICAFITLYIYAAAKHQPVFPRNAYLIPQLILLVTTFQFAIELLPHRFRLKELLTACVVSSLVGWYYGLLLTFLDNAFGQNTTSEVQPLTPLYLIGAVILVVAWWVFMYGKTLVSTFLGTKGVDKAYVTLLNASQPHANAITPIRKQYKYHEANL